MTKLPKIPVHNVMHQQLLQCDSLRGVLLCLISIKCTNWQRKNVVVEIILQSCLFMMSCQESLWQVGQNGMTGAWICRSCLGSGTSKSWKPLEHVYCQPVQVVTPLVQFPSCQCQRQSKRRSGGRTHRLAGDPSCESVSQTTDATRSVNEGSVCG